MTIDQATKLRASGLLDRIGEAEYFLGRQVIIDEKADAIIAAMIENKMDSRSAAALMKAWMG